MIFFATKDDHSTNVSQTCLGYLGYGEENKDIFLIYPGFEY
jgi:hypothetical protein